MQKLAISLMLCVVILLVGLYYPLYYEVGSVHARVVSDSTGQPIPHAAVLVAWGSNSNIQSADWFRKEFSSTADDGTFTVPGWLLWWQHWVSKSSAEFLLPTIYVLKSGYVPVKISGSNILEEQAPGREQVQKTWYGKGVVSGIQDATLRMTHLPSNPKSRYEAFHKVFSFSQIVSEERACIEGGVIESGFLGEIFKELRAAMNANTSVIELSEKDRIYIASNTVPNVDTCIRFSEGLAERLL